MCFLITGFAAEVRPGNYGFGRDIKIPTVFKVVLAVNKTISIASNRGPGTLQPIKKKWIRPLETDLGGFGKDKPPTK